MLERNLNYTWQRHVLKFLSTETNEVTEKSKYLKWGLDSYNKFLKKTIGLQINNIEEIYSKIMVSASLKENKN